MPGVPVYSLLLVCVLPIQSAHEAAGATGTRHSPRPPWGREINAQLGHIVSRGRERMFGFAVIARSGETKIPYFLCGKMDCFAEPVIGLAGGETRWRSMTALCESDATLNSDSVIPGWRVSARPGISRFRVRRFASPRNDVVWIANPSGAPSRDAVVRHDGKHVRRRVTLRYPASPASHAQDMDVPSRSRHGNGLGFYPTG